nr:tRNA (guanine(46)-N(7))-methyltransferase TrmB [Pseudomonadota bacterium]
MTCVTPLPDNPQSPVRLNLYGRRQGRPLRPHRKALVQDLLPRLRIDLPPPPGKIDPAALFPPQIKEIWLEIGFGAGEHLAAQAAAHPDTGIIGAEFFMNGVASLLGHMERQGLSNVRIVPGDARPLLDTLPDASISRCFVLFPDPWPKKRHAFRRFIGPENLDRLARILKPGAWL